MPSCESVLQAFGARHFADWTGLEPGCAKARVAAVFPSWLPGIGAGQIGDRAAQYHMLEIAGYPRPVRAWFDDDILLMLDAEYPDPAHVLAGDIEALGEPEARLDCWWDVVSLARAEWVFAARGLAAFINPDNRIVLRVLTFPPVSLAEYERSFRVSWRSIEFRR